jgi:hypothetical protein
MSVGAEWGLGEWLVLRGGVGAGGISELAVGLGVGLRPFNWLAIDVGSSEATELVDGERVDLSIRVTAGLDALLR